MRADARALAPSDAVPGTNDSDAFDQPDTCADRCTSASADGSAPAISDGGSAARTDGGSVWGSNGAAYSYSVDRTIASTNALSDSRLLGL